MHDVFTKPSILQNKHNITQNTTLSRWFYATDMMLIVSAIHVFKWKPQKLHTKESIKQDLKTDSMWRKYQIYIHPNTTALHTIMLAEKLVWLNSTMNCARGVSFQDSYFPKLGVHRQNSQSWRLLTSWIHFTTMAVKK